MPHVQSPRQPLCFSRDPVRGLFGYHAVVYQVDTDEAHVVGPVHSLDAKLIASYLMRCSETKDDGLVGTAADNIRGYTFLSL